MGNQDDQKNIFHDLQFDLIIAALSYSIFATMSPPRSMKGIGYHDDKQNIFHDLQFVLHIHSLPRIDCQEIWLAVTNGNIDNDGQNARENDDEADGDDVDDEVAYLAALTGVHAIMEARCLVPTNSTQHAVVPVEF